MCEYRSNIVTVDKDNNRLNLEIYYKNDENCILFNDILRLTQESDDPVECECITLNYDSIIKLYKFIKENVL